MQQQNQLKQIQAYYNTLRGVPNATADIRGSEEYPLIRGTALFYQTRAGVLVTVYATGLPRKRNACEAPVFALHIHSGESCTGDRTDPFKDAKTHDNPNNCLHPHHAGDLAPLFGNQGTAFSVLLTDRFSVRDIFGKTVIIHRNPDDFITQPSGNAGTKIACGVIQPTRRCARQR